MSNRLFLTRPLLTRPLQRALVVLWALGFLAGCAAELDPAKPDGAYHLFRDAMLQGDAQGVWANTDEKTHRYFQEQFDYLVEMDEMIARYLPQTDHRIARNQSGTVLLQEVRDGQGLFLKVFQADKIPNEEAIRIGSDIDELIVAKDDSGAKVITRAGQEYVLTRDAEAKRWFVRLPTSVESSMQWLGQNRSAMQQTVEDLIAEERDRREAIIAELMQLKTD